ncbi:MAG: hypothetical protein U0174_22715 [Polyangiaceae bacterium]
MNYRRFLAACVFAPAFLFACSSETTTGASLDASAEAGRLKGDAGPACGTTTCGPDQYCKEASGGAQRPDGGSNQSYACEPVPANCINANVPTCACVAANGAGGCLCTDGANGPSIKCLYP